MDRAFLSYYEQELAHIRKLAHEFATMNPTVARNLSLDTVPCPDPYVERLLEGVAYLGARTRLKLDMETSRYVRTLIDALYPDLAGPAPAVSIAQLVPGAQVDNMIGGHCVKRGTRVVAGLREGLTTRAIYSTAQDVHLWPVEIVRAEYLQDRGALKSAGVSDRHLQDAEAGLRLVCARTSPGALADLALDKLDVYLDGRGRGSRLFDSIFGWGHSVLCRPTQGDRPYETAAAPAMVGIVDDEGLLPRVGAAFEGYRLLREYFLMPKRFHYVRLSGMGTAVRQALEGAVEIVLLFTRQQPAIAETDVTDFQLFTTPLVNLFERECNVVEIDARRSAHVVHTDRTRPRDFEIYRLLKVEDAEREGSEAELKHLYSVEQSGKKNLVYATERRPRRPGEEELRRGRMRTGYAGDDFFISIARPPSAHDASRVRRLDIRALCTNRDLPILDDNPNLSLETGDPVAEIRLLQAFRRPRPSLVATLPDALGGETSFDDLTWRWIAQLSLNHLSLAEESRDAEPLRATLELYADRGDPACARHAKSVTRVTSKPIVERLALPGPICFAHGTEISIDIDEGVLSGESHLLLSAILSQLFTRYAAINSFVHTKTRLTQQQEEIRWPMTPGVRGPI